MILEEDRSSWLRRFKRRFGVDLAVDFGSEWFKDFDEIDLYHIWDCMFDEEFNEGLGL